MIKSKFFLILAGCLAFAAACDKKAETPAAAQSSGGGLSVISGVARKPAAGALLYLYRSGDDLRAPPFSRIGPLGPDGSYSVELPPGKYVFVLRQRDDGADSGPVNDGDVKSDPIPVTVEAGKPLNIDVNAYVKQGNTKQSFGPEAEWKALITGIVLDGEGKPVEGIRVHAYDHVQMSERPKFVSAKTGPDGRYELHLTNGGTYYLCARDKYGGPPKVGDLYGRYDKGTVEPSAVNVNDGESLKGVDILVHMVW